MSALNPARRLLRRPDLRHIVVPRPSAAPLSDTEVDYDDLIVHRSWRTYSETRPDAIHAMMYELSQRQPGPLTNEHEHYYKAVRFLRVTRVPRYLRQTQGGGGPHMVFQQQREMLAALREQGVLFVNMIAKSPQIPLVFAWGVQATGDTPEEAIARADESFAVLEYQVHGTYQQLETTPLTTSEGEELFRYQQQWQHLAAARGRPMVLGDPHAGASAWLDGNRTDPESSLNALESFIRGMGDKSFMLNLITVPVSPSEMASAWRNLSRTLSEVRSDTQGTRSVNAGVALPLGMGTSFGDSHGSSHSSGESLGVGLTDGLSASETLGQSQALAHGESASVSESHTVGQAQANSVGQTQSVSDSVSQGQSVTDTVTVGQSTGESAQIGESLGQSAQVGESAGQSQSLGMSEGVSESVSQSQGVSQAHGLSQQVGQSVSESMSQSESLSQSQGVSIGATQSQSTGQSLSESMGQSVAEGRSLGFGQSESHAAGATGTTSWGDNWSMGTSAGMNGSEGVNTSRGESLSQSLGVTDTISEQISDGESQGWGSSFRAAVLGFGSGFDASEGANWGRSAGGSDAMSGSQTGGVTNQLGHSQSQGWNLGQSGTLGGSEGGSYAENQTHSVGATSSESVNQTQAESYTAGRGINHGESVGQSLSQSQGLTRGAGISQGQSVVQSLSQGESVTEAVALTNASALGHSTGQTATQGASLSQSASQGLSASQSASQGVSSSQSASAGQSVGQSASVGRSVGLSNSASQTASVSEAQSSAASQGVSRTESQGVSRAVTEGVSQANSSQQAMSDAYMVAMSRTAMQSGSLGVVPSFGISISRQTLDVGKQILGDMLEAQLRRYVDAVESGAFFYQMFLTCPDKETLAGGSGLLKSAFWGPGSKTARLPMPFHVAIIDDPDERRRMLEHAGAFTSYRKREPRTELIEPYLYSTLLTPAEGAVFSHPPVAEALGMLAVHDSMPVMAMPWDRSERDLYLGRIVNGERANTTNQRFGVDLDELNHTLVAGTTGSGKTTTLMRLIGEAVRHTRDVIERDEDDPTQVTTRVLPAGALCLDWMRNFRDLAGIVEPERFQFLSLSNAKLGRFRFNLLELPDLGMDPAEWAGTVADLFMISYGLGEYARSIVFDAIWELYTANRLGETTLLPALADGDGVEVRAAVTLEPVDRADLPNSSIAVDSRGAQVANVFSDARLSRLVGLPDIAALVLAKIEEVAKPGGSNAYGTAFRDRIQTVWRRISPFVADGPLGPMFAADPSLRDRECMGVTDLIDPDRGLVTVIEADGVDMQHRRLMLGGVMLATWRYGQFHGEGVFDQNGKGPGTFIVLEEAHELLGAQGDGEDREAAAKRTAIYEAMFRRARALGLRLVIALQNPADAPRAITSNTTTVISHRLTDDQDRDLVSTLFNWVKAIGQHYREWRYLGEMPLGYCVVRLNAKTHFLESAPVHILTDPMGLASVSDRQLERLATQRAARRSSAQAASWPDSPTTPAG